MGTFFPLRFKKHRRNVVDRRAVPNDAHTIAMINACIFYSVQINFGARNSVTFVFSIGVGFWGSGD